MSNSSGISAVQALDSNPIPKVHVSCTMPYGSAGHSVLALTGVELNEACRPGTTTVCSCFLIVAAQCLNLCDT